MFQASQSLPDISSVQGGETPAIAAEQSPISQPQASSSHNSHPSGSDCPRREYYFGSNCYGDNPKAVDAYGRGIENKPFKRL